MLKDIIAVAVMITTAVGSIGTVVRLCYKEVRPHKFQTGKMYVPEIMYEATCLHDVRGMY